MMGKSNKEAAVSFLLLASSGKVREAYKKHIAPGFRHHNAYFPGDPESLAKGMEESAKEFPHKVFDVQRVLEDGDLVAVHARVRLKPDGQDIALIHIFRFEGDRIVELWEAAQPVPETSPNKNGVF
jgi:predicted SnoaL-like aldol condensation-catalyzing enzyme